MISPHTRALLESTDGIKLEASPYTYVRTIVMESKLLREQDYAKLLKMDVAEITQFLEESTYKKEIDELAMNEQGVTLIEHAVNRNFRRAVEKLRRISDDNLRFLIDAYLWRNDVQNIKTLLRAKHSGEKSEKVQNLFVPGTVTKEELVSIYNTSSSVEEALRKIDLPFTAEATRIFREHGLTAVEGAMTRMYYEQTLLLAGRIKGEAQTLREFLQTEVDMVNLLTIIKLKHEGASIEGVYEQLVAPQQVKSVGDVRGQMRKQTLSKLVHARSVAEVFAVLDKTSIRSVFERGRESYERTGSLLDVERDIQSYLLRKATLLTHQHPLSVDVVLGYLFAKVIEIRNILILIKGKQLGVPQQFMEQEIVVA